MSTLTTLTSVETATKKILQHKFEWDVESVAFADSLGRFLAEDIHADRPFPPFDRVMMDGIALRYADFATGQRLFPIKGVQAAGAPPLILPLEGTCFEVMTGAVLPKGTDTVVRYEDIEIADNEVIVRVDSIRNGQNIHLLGSDRKQGSQLLPTGQKIVSADAALFATVGKTSVKVKSLPRVCVLSTGDELVKVEEMPAAHQIRRSNVHALLAALKNEGIEGSSAHLLDSKTAILAEMERLLAQNDVLLLSGGVSKGKFDYLPECFEALGVKKQFHFVAQRPGKPFWFGVAPKGQLVFAFPGNPVSTFVGFHRYFLPWLRNSYGQMPFSPQFAILKEDFSFKPALTYFLQVETSFDTEGRFWAQPVVGQGSGDLANLADVDGFLELPDDRVDFKKGEAFRFMGFR